jgi:ribosomal protein S18 acetylase RimI-like enzyme
VRAGNQRAQALYRGLGYAQVGLRRGYYPAAVRREDAVVMSLALALAAPDGGPHAVD